MFYNNAVQCKPVYALDAAHKLMPNGIEAYVDATRPDGVRQFEPLTAAMTPTYGWITKKDLKKRTVRKIPFTECRSEGVKCLTSRRERFANLWCLLGYLVVMQGSGVELLAGGTANVFLPEKQDIYGYRACWGKFPDPRLPQDRFYLTLIQEDDEGQEMLTSFMQRSHILLVPDAP